MNGTTKIDKSVKYSFPVAIAVIWMLVFSVDTTTWNNISKLVVQMIIPILLTFIGATAFFKWDKICKELDKKE